MSDRVGAPLDLETSGSLGTSLLMQHELSRHPSRPTGAGQAAAEAREVALLSLHRTLDADAIANRESESRSRRRLNSTLSQEHPAAARQVPLGNGRVALAQATSQVPQRQHHGSPERVPRPLSVTDVLRPSPKAGGLSPPTQRISSAASTQHSLSPRVLRFADSVPSSAASTLSRPAHPWAQQQQQQQQLPSYTTTTVTARGASSPMPTAAPTNAAKQGNQRPPSPEPIRAVNEVLLLPRPTSPDRSRPSPSPLTRIADASASDMLQMLAGRSPPGRVAAVASAASAAGHSTSATDTAETAASRRLGVLGRDRLDHTSDQHHKHPQPHHHQQQHGRHPVVPLVVRSVSASRRYQSPSHAPSAVDPRAMASSRQPDPASASAPTSWAHSQMLLFSQGPGTSLPAPHSTSQPSSLDGILATLDRSRSPARMPTAHLISPGQQHPTPSGRYQSPSPAARAYTAQHPSHAPGRPVSPVMPRYSASSAARAGTAATGGPLSAAVPAGRSLSAPRGAGCPVVPPSQELQQAQQQATATALQSIQPRALGVGAGAGVSVGAGSFAFPRGAALPPAAPAADRPDARVFDALRDRTAAVQQLQNSLLSDIISDGAEPPPPPPPPAPQEALASASGRRGTAKGRARGKDRWSGGGDGRGGSDSDEGSVDLAEGLIAKRLESVTAAAAALAWGCTEQRRAAVAAAAGAPVLTPPSEHNSPGRARTASPPRGVVVMPPHVPVPSGLGPVPDMVMPQMLLQAPRGEQVEVLQHSTTGVWVSGGTGGRGRGSGRQGSSGVGGEGGGGSGETGPAALLTSLMERLQQRRERRRQGSGAVAEQAAGRGLGAAPGAAAGGYGGGNGGGGRDGRDMAGADGDQDVDIATTGLVRYNRYGGFRQLLAALRCGSLAPIAAA